MKEHNVGYTEALRATAPTYAWDSGTTPWLRAADSMFTCYWCGEQTATRSWGDLAGDTGRVEFYCENPDCTAREVDVVILDDRRHSARDRADVRALTRHPGEVMTHLVFTDSDAPPRYMVRSEPQPAARTGGGPVRCLFCGDTSCVVDRSDNDADIGRLKFRCTNTYCDATRLDAIVGRDGTVETSEREDVKTLRDIDDPPRPRATKPMRRRPLRTAGMLDRRLGSSPRHP
jgi:hypothetical protein